MYLCLKSLHSLLNIRKKKPRRSFIVLKKLPDFLPELALFQFLLHIRKYMEMYRSQEEERKSAVLLSPLSTSVSWFHQLPPDSFSSGRCVAILTIELFFCLSIFSCMHIDPTRLTLSPTPASIDRLILSQVISLSIHLSVYLSWRVHLHHIYRSRDLSSSLCRLHPTKTECLLISLSSSQKKIHPPAYRRTRS